MTEYISRSSALQAVGDVHPLDYNGQGIVERIKGIPAADVVEVVRCRECVYRIAYGCKRIGGISTPPNWYCPMGKRKDGGQDE